MALTATNKGTGGTAASASTTFAINPGSNFTAGALVLLAIACDNSRSGGVAFVTFTVTDNAGGGTNTWVLRSQQALYDVAGTSAGITGGIFERAATAPQLLSSNTITVTWDTAVTAKAYTLTEVTSSIGVASVTSGSVWTSQTYNAGSPPNFTTTSLTSGSMVLAAAFSENTTSSTSTPWVGDADTTNGSWSAIQTIWSGAANTSNVGVGSQYKIVSATATQTWNPTIAAGGTPDCSFGYVVVIETATYRASLAWAQLQMPVSFLAGVAATGGINNALTPTSSVALTGVAAAGSITPNSLLTGGGSQRAYMAWAELELPGFDGDEIVLSQQAGVGTINNALTPLSGVTRAFLAWAQLDLPSSNNVTLTGVAAAGVANNTLTPIKDATIVELVGVAAAGEAGDLSGDQYAQLTQKAAVGRIGTLAPADLNYGYIGQLTPTQSVVLSQAAAVGSLGPVGIAGNPDSQAPLTHKPAVGSAGTLVPQQEVALTGKQATGTAGSVGVAFSYSVELTQAAAVGSAGILAEGFDNPSYAFLGSAAAVGSAGVLGVDVTVMLQGVSASGLAGRFTGLPDSWVPVPPDGGIWVPVADNVTDWTPA